eukprot:TRINITY_DN3999_c0_g2_i1.p1 TRINITY_DN3999_c0_g2~~TRINITY_DN3999_c0_g2_i1.p1  ORF type:complete len:492 (-),score=102.08 TRINITY_DN3999_c0_g2_i1:51-1526(-)
MSYDPSKDDIDACNVFIKFLPPEVTDTGLYAMFSPFGNIKSCKVMVDTSNGNSLGYGFCRFSDPKEAELAIKAMSGTRYGNKTLLCKHSNSASSTSTSPSDNLYVKPLLPTTTKEQLQELFSHYGAIRECKVMVDVGTGKSRQIGFVRFYREDEAIRAQRAMKNYKLSDDSPPLVVKFAETNEQKEARRNKISSNKEAAKKRKKTAYSNVIQPPQVELFPVPYSTQIGGSVMSYGIPDLESTDSNDEAFVQPDLDSLVPSYGSVQEGGDRDVGSLSKILLDTTLKEEEISQLVPTTQLDTPPSLTPMALPYFSTPLEAHTSFLGPPSESLNFGSSTANSALYPTYPSISGQDANLFVFHLPTSVTTDKLAELFAKFGPLKSVKVMIDPQTQESRGFGFVQYFNIEDAIEAIGIMNGYPIENKHLKVAFKDNKKQSNRPPRSKPTGSSFTDSLTYPFVPLLPEFSLDHHFSQSLPTPISYNLDDDDPPPGYQ